MTATRRWFLISLGLTGRTLLGSTGAASERRYRADAQIRLLGMTLFSREGVGSGFARLEREGPNERLCFGGGSYPERARGLNRLGYIEESNCFGNETLRECRYAGFMTSSTEESLAEGAKALEKKSETQIYAAIEGRHAAGRADSAQLHFEMPSAWAWHQAEPLWRRVRERLPLQGAAVRRTVLGTEEALPGFLSAVQAAHRHAPAVTAASYAFAGRRHELKLRWSRERDGRQRGEGVVRKLPDGKPLPFQIWYANPADELPQRVEWSPRSFLRLSFTADDAVQVSLLEPIRKVKIT